ncbi:MAG: FtsQ-type POTRA domain-containing protein [Spirochaetes bacterium]|nr:FtsQ-type POTRA domain-containing protein [Spirochaetota bacterium]MBU0955899.1 FtsQ-type POTRA domain-containing protein [Spirochaetota bacterium]
MSEYVWHEAAANNRKTALAGEEIVPASEPGRLHNSALGVVRTVLVLFTVILAAFLFTVLIFLPATEIKQVVVSGMDRLSSTEILQWSTLPTGVHWFSVDTHALTASLERNPRLAEVSVSRKFPDTVLVEVKERTALALLYVRDANNRLRAHCIDRSGVVFAPLAAYDADSKLPVISGIEVRGLQYGMTLGPRFDSMLKSLTQLQSAQPQLLSAISEIRVVDLKEAGIELLLYPVHYPVPVRMRPELNADMVKSVLLVLDVVAGRGLIPTLQELDFRTDTYVYRTKEAVSG